MTETTATLEEMEKKIKTMETRLASMKKAYKNRKLEGLRIAMEARKSAEDAVMDELKALGYKRVPYKNLTSYVDQMNSVWRWQVLYSSKKYQVARRLGYRSGLEVKLSEYLDELKIKYIYEGIKIEWEDLAYRQYTPDFVLPNGIIIETKGLFTVADRRKHLCIQQQHPKLDIRFVFTSSRRKLQKGSKTTYGMWCEKNNLKYHDRIIPEDWLKERKKKPHPVFIEFTGKKIIRRYT